IHFQTVDFSSHHITRNGHSIMKLCRLWLQSFFADYCSRRYIPYFALRSYASMHRHEIDSALGCNVYISEGRNKNVINRLQAEANATQGVALANVFVDAPYNRTGFTLVSTQADRLTNAVVRLSRVALQLLDLRSHAATHPRLGVVDHISLHPLGSLVRPSSTHLHPAPAPWPLHPEDHYYHHHHHHQYKHRHNNNDPHESQHSHHHHHRHQQQHQVQHTHQQESGGSGSGGSTGHDTVWEPPPQGLTGLAVAASCAQYIAWHLSQEVEVEDLSPSAAAVAAAKLEPAPALPVYLYGYAHPSRRCLSEVRRQLGYFRRAADGSWGSGSGANSRNLQVQQQMLPDPNDLLQFSPDLGPVEPPPQSGLLTIGAVPWVTNYNVPLQDVDLEEAKWLARAVSERGGGLPGVEAMALKHEDDTVEVACNLLDETQSSPHAVQARLEALASSRGLDQWAVLWGYRTNKTPEELLHIAAAALAAKAAEERRMRSS
ncbi:hypothetical protein VaNZ11_010333, partial [Volvox africanus]